jgi:hypothetical protein
MNLESFEAPFIYCNQFKFLVSPRSLRALNYSFAVFFHVLSRSQAVITTVVHRVQLWEIRGW